MTPWTVARQAPLSMEFSRKEYWSEFPFPSSEDLPDPGSILVSLAFPALAGRFFATVPPVKPYLVSIFAENICILFFSAIAVVFLFLFFFVLGGWDFGLTGQLAGS